MLSEHGEHRTVGGRSEDSVCLQAALHLSTMINNNDGIKLDAVTTTVLEKRKIMQLLLRRIFLYSSLYLNKNCFAFQNIFPTFHYHQQNQQHHHLITMPRRKTGTRSSLAKSLSKATTAATPECDSNSDTPDGNPRMCFDSVRAFHNWLDENHKTCIGGIWLMIPKKDSGKTGPTYLQALDEALCYGWIVVSL